MHPDTPLPPEAPIWIDTDMGFDDLAAVLLVAQAGRIIAGLSLVAGNAGLAQVTANAMASARLFGWGFPIHAGAATALDGSQTDAAYVLGETAMRTVGRSLPPCDDAPASDDAVAALADWLDGGGRAVLALGPLTNVARLLARRPDLAARLHLVWMGGAATGGNHTAVAEFNAASDPEAVAATIAAGARLRMVGLDCCRQVCVTEADAAPLRALPGERAALLADLLAGYARIRDPSGMVPIPIYDPVAAAALLAPETVDFAPARLDCELAGTHTRGMTVVEWRAKRAAPNALVATTADGPAIRAMLAAALTRAATGGTP